ncbi:MAG: hypothetical protein ABI832_13850 [bacterium]
MAIRAASRADATKDDDHPKLTTDHRERRVAGPLTLISLAIAALWSGSTKADAATSDLHHSSHHNAPKDATAHDHMAQARPVLHNGSTPETPVQDHSAAAAPDLALNTGKPVNAPKAAVQEAAAPTPHPHPNAPDRMAGRVDGLSGGSDLSAATEGSTSAGGTVLPSSHGHAPAAPSAHPAPIAQQPVVPAKPYLLADLLSDLGQITHGQTDPSSNQLHDVAIDDFLSATALDALQRGQDPMAVLTSLGPEFQPEVAALSAQHHSPLYAILHSADHAAAASFAASHFLPDAASLAAPIEAGPHDLPLNLNHSVFM